MSTKIIHHVARLGPQHCVRESVAVAAKIADASRLLRAVEAVSPDDTNARNAFGREHANACARLLATAKKLGQTIDLQLREQPDGETFVSCRVRGGRRTGIY